MASKALAKAPTHDIIGIKVKFTIDSKDRLRRVVFGLEKSVEGDETTWTIDFQLFEREKKSEDFGDARVDLHVEVDSKLNGRAETAAKNGLTDGQAAHAIGPAADAASDAAAGEIDQEEADEAIQTTLKKK
jgi:hypothetical protein